MEMSKKLEFTLFKGAEYEYLNVESDKIDTYVDYINKNNITSIMINEAYGYKSEDIRFLERCTNIEALYIVNNNIVDLSPIKKIKKLRLLRSVSVPKLEFDLSLFKDLKILSIVNHKNWINLENCFNLKKLSLWKTSMTEIGFLKGLKQLEFLSLTQGKIESLKGLENFSKLKHLECNHLPKLTSISLKMSNKSITNFKLESCKKIINFSEDIIYFQKVEVLSFLYCAKEIKSVSFINKLENIKQFYLKGSKINDKNTQPFILLEDFYFDNKKYYNHSYKELKMKS